MPAAPREKIVVSTDKLKLTFDTEGGTLVKAELLGQIDMADKSKNFVLLDESANRVYTAQTGLIGAAAGATPFPTHKTLMTVLPGERKIFAV